MYSICRMTGSIDVNSGPGRWEQKRKSWKRDLPDSNREDVEDDERCEDEDPDRYPDKVRC